jgi:hypothetical protein
MGRFVPYCYVCKYRKIKGCRAVRKDEEATFIFRFPENKKAIPQLLLRLPNLAEFCTGTRI